MIMIKVTLNIQKAEILRENYEVVWPNILLLFLADFLKYQQYLKILCLRKPFCS